MRSPEQRGGLGDHEREGPAYHQTARFRGEHDSGQAYNAAQQTIYESREDLDLSAYRFQLNRVYHVTVLGQEPPAQIAERIRGILAAGELTELPPVVLRQLHQRRQEETQRGPWVERHYRPDKRLS